MELRITWPPDGLFARTLTLAGSIKPWLMRTVRKGLRVAIAVGSGLLEFNGISAPAISKGV